jgi:hypothetical protein
MAGHFLPLVVVFYSISRYFSSCLAMAFKHAEGSNGQTSNRNFQSLTVERLRALLRAKGLPTKGKKASSLNIHSYISCIQTAYG